MQYRTIDDGPRHRRELWTDDDTNVAHLYVIDYQMRIGDAAIRMAGIGDVYTEWKHRMKGYMRFLYEDTLTYMTEEGYDVSMLFGIPNFYTKFGYATCLPKCALKIKTRDAEGAVLAMDAGQSRSIEPGDMPAVLELYATENMRRTGTLIRTPEQFTEFDKGTDWGVRAETALWKDAGGRVLGYLVWDRRLTEVRVAELEAWDTRLFPTMLHSLAEQAVEKRCEQITFDLPPDHAFAEFAQQFGMTSEIVYPRYSDGMLRILNQPPLFEKVVPVLSDRLAAESNFVPIESLALETDLGTTALRFSGTTVSLGTEKDSRVRLALSQDKLIQLMMGYRVARDVLDAPGVALEGASREDVLPTLDVLFPRGVPFMWTPDHF